MVKNPPAMWDTWVWSLGWEDSPGGGHGNPVQYSGLKNPQGQRSPTGYSPWGHKESDRTECLSTHWHCIHEPFQLGFGTLPIKRRNVFHQPLDLCLNLAKSSKCYVSRGVCTLGLSLFYWWWGHWWRWQWSWLRHLEMKRTEML